MKHFFLTLAMLLTCLLQLGAQERTVENRPYTDLRPIHFGILVGTHWQDMEFTNVGPQTLTLADGTEQEYLITCDQDRWDNGFNVGVLCEVRLNRSFQLRIAPALYFGTRHFSFKNLDPNASDSLIERKQTLKTAYISCAADLIFAAERFNNHRPYIMLGINPVLNLNTKSNDYIKLKRSDVFVEAGVGCDFYLPFFKLRPELKFMYSLTNCLDKGHADNLRDESMKPYAKAINKARSKVIALTFYFE
jgi:hypothetical protein